MHIDTQIVNGRAVIGLAGRFSFSANGEFRRCCDSALQAILVRELEIDFADVQYLDSSALGMLLMLRERAEGVRKRVVLSNCRGVVKQVLDIANFAKLFRIL
jgi:anti-anti-sigma factor